MKENQNEGATISAGTKRFAACREAAEMGMIKAAQGGLRREKMP
jgi:hypothetical protein